MRHIITIFLYSILLTNYIFAIEKVDIAKSNSISLLEHSEVYLDKKGLNLTQIENRKLFKPYANRYLNNSQSGSVVWLKFKLYNSSSKTLNRLLLLSSQSLEHITLFENGKEPKENGIMANRNHNTLYYNYKLVLKPNESRQFYLKVFSKHSSFFFSFRVLTDNEYLKVNANNIPPRFMLIGFLIGLFIYILVLYIYTRDRSYLYYAMYLFFLVWHQFTYLGLMQIYAPRWFVKLDLELTIPKLGFILLSAILFAISFLQVKKESLIYKIYLLFFIIGLYVIFFMNNLPTTLIIGIVFVFFNFLSALEAYFIRRVEQARLFILGFGIVSTVYILIVLDTFNLIPSYTLSHFIHTRAILLWATAIEVILLTLAFVDRYRIVQIEKEKILKNRQEIIENEVKRKTLELSKSLKEKELLLQEIRHRVKNNLQIILSIIRLQSLKAEDNQTKEFMANLENRINAISKVYNMLVNGKEIESINMHKYITILINDIKRSLQGYGSTSVDINLNVDIILPLKEAVYVGVIINELVTNSFKHAFDGKSGIINIKLTRHNSKHILEISDNGNGFSYKLAKNSLGLKIIEILVKEQLEGSVKMITKPSAHCIIEF